MVLQAIWPSKPIFPSCSLSNIRKLEYLSSPSQIFLQIRIFVQLAPLLIWFFLKYPDTGSCQASKNILELE